MLVFLLALVLIIFSRGNGAGDVGGQHCSTTCVAWSLDATKYDGGQRKFSPSLDYCWLESSSFDSFGNDFFMSELSLGFEANIIFH